MNRLHQHAADYLAVRRALGFKLAEHGRLLPDFVAYLAQRDAATITVEAAGPPNRKGCNPTVGSSG